MTIVIIIVRIIVIITVKIIMVINTSQVLYAESLDALCCMERLSSFCICCNLYFVFVYLLFSTCLQYILIITVIILVLFNITIFLFVLIMIIEITTHFSGEGGSFEGVKLLTRSGVNKMR